MTMPIQRITAPAFPCSEEDVPQSLRSGLSRVEYMATHIMASMTVEDDIRWREWTLTRDLYELLNVVWPNEDDPAQSEYVERQNVYLEQLSHVQEVMARVAVGRATALLRVLDADDNVEWEY